MLFRRQLPAYLVSNKVVKALNARICWILTLAVPYKVPVESCGMVGWIDDMTPLISYIAPRNMSDVCGTRLAARAPHPKLSGAMPCQRGAMPCLRVFGVESWSETG